MSEAIDDPYCYAGTPVLKNIPGLRDQAALERFETVVTALRAEEPLPAGRLGVRHYRAIHHHLFQDVYRWAGRYRTVRIAKAGSVFCYPEHISGQMNALFVDLRSKQFLRGLVANAFAAEAANFLATLNAIHAFRDGNGRAQLAFLALLASEVEHPLALERLDPASFLAAMIESFGRDTRPLTDQIRNLMIQPEAS
jgi:cell filamentation protein